MTDNDNPNPEVSDLTPPNPVRWSLKDRTAWSDIFMAYSELIMSGTVQENEGAGKYPTEQLKSDVKLAAELTDIALQEMHVRFEVLHPLKAKTRPTPTPSRGGRERETRGRSRR